MPIRIDNSRPVYLQIEEYIRNAVITNIYPPGSRIPTVRELAATMKVNPNTVQRAMTELEQQGLLLTNGTLGKVVTSDGDIIDSVRQAAIQSAVKESATRFSALGLSMQDAAQLLLLQEKEV